jgi:hypothetical protein
MQIKIKEILFLFSNIKINKFFYSSISLIFNGIKPPLIKFVELKKSYNFGWGGFSVRLIFRPLPFGPRKQSLIHFRFFLYSFKEEIGPTIVLFFEIALDIC